MKVFIPMHWFNLAAFINLHCDFDNVCSTAREQKTMTMNWMVTRVPCPRQTLINIKQQLQQSGWYDADKSLYPTRIMSNLGNNVISDAMFLTAYLADKTGISLKFLKLRTLISVTYKISEPASKLALYPQNIL